MTGAVPSMLSSLPHPSDNHLLRPQEVARIFGVSVVTVRQWSQDGKLPHTRTLGGHHRYRWADVKNLTEQLNVAVEP